MFSPEKFPAALTVDRIREQIRALQGVRHRLTAPEALEQAATYLSKSLGNMGYDVTEHRFEEQGSPFRNIIATRTGTTLPHERVCVVAHYDTFATSPGADDNASGVAVLLELAELLRQTNLDRTIQFIGVSLEENQREGEHDSGLCGSKALARCARESGWDIAGVIVLESVAYAGNTIVQGAPAGLPFPIPAIGNFIAVIGNEHSRPLVSNFVDSVERWRVNLPVVPLVVPGNGEILPDTRRSDHAPFWDNGYPAIMVTDTTNFRNPHYHQPTDTLETVNPAFAAEVCRAVGGLILAMAHAPH